MAEKPKSGSVSPKAGNLSFSGVGSPAQEEAYEKRMEALKQRENKVAKKDRELSNRLSDLERRTKTIEETEEKYGSIAQREAAADTKEKELLNVQKEIKRRDKMAKEAEQANADKETELFSKEAFLSGKEKEIQQKIQSFETREKELFERMIVTEDAEKKLGERAKQLNAFEESLNQRNVQVTNIERMCKTREAAIAVREKETQDRAKEVRGREDAVERANGLQQQRNTALTQREQQLKAERDRLNEKQQAIEQAENQVAADTKNCALKKEEIQRRIAAVEETEREAAKKKKEASVVASEAAKASEIAQKQLYDNRRYEVELNRLREELKQQETDLRQRERRVGSERRSLEERIAFLEQKEERLKVQVKQLEDLDEETARRAKDVSAREEDVARRERVVQKNQERCNGKEHANIQKAQLLDRKEKDLVDWMKEMEWREMMLGDREAIVDREPVTIRVAGVSSSLSPAPEGFSNRAFGHAIIDVQLRRLKDQYISAQMKHAREEISGTGGLLKFRKGRRMPRSGITTTNSGEDVSLEVAKQSEVQELQREVHRQSTEFRRLMSRCRAFDSFEDPASPEKLDHLDFFSGNERTLLTMAANMEYTLKTYEDFFVERGTCPLDEKDKAKNVPDLVNRMSTWWRATRDHLHLCLLQLLRDRKRYLEQSLLVLASKEQLHNVVDKKHMAEGLTATASAASYTAVTSVDHVRESRILAPRGLATLKAVSSAQEDRPATAPDGQQLLQQRSRNSNGAAGDPSMISASAAEVSADGGVAFSNQQQPSTVTASRPHTRSSMREDAAAGQAMVFQSQKPELEMALVTTGRTASAGAVRRGERFDVMGVVTTKRPDSSPYKLLKAGLSPGPLKHRHH